MSGSSPVVEVDPGLVSAWLDVRYAGHLRQDVLTTEIPSRWSAPLVRLILYALAESVVNAGESCNWPQHIRLDVYIGAVAGQARIMCGHQPIDRWARDCLQAGAVRGI